MIAKHKLNIAYFKSGTGFTATCTCGQRISRPTGCNFGGMNYAKLAVWQEYARHCAEVGVSPTPSRECSDLAACPKFELAEQAAGGEAR
jgi:hypothetical protein